MVLAIACLFVTSMAINVRAEEKEFTGYLCDVTCGVAGKDAAGTDLTQTPEKYTVAGLKLEESIKAGYGMFVKDEAGVFKFHKFDAAGSEMAKKEIVDKTEKTEGVEIVVKGELQEDGTLKVASIVAK